MKDGLSRLIYEKAVIPYLNQKCRQVVAMDKRDRLGLEHDSKGRFTKKDGSNPETGVAFALKYVDPKQLEAVRKVGNYTTSDGVKHDTRINVVTGKPISKELNDAIDALMSGVYVTDAEIGRTPEWIKARAELKAHKAAVRKKNGVVFTNEIDTPERNKMRKDIEEHFMSDTIDEGLNPDAFKSNPDLKPFKVKKGKIIDVITGLPAAGKSTTFATRLSVENGSRLIDSDEVKKQFPEFNKGLGASLVHEESSAIAKNILVRSIAQGDNITYPIIGFKPDKLRELFSYCRKNGYQIRLHLNELDMRKAKGRMLLRFAERGRFLPISLYRKYGDNPTTAYHEVKGETDFHDWYQSDTGAGKKPKLMESVIVRK